MRVHIHRALQFDIGGKDSFITFITLCLYSKAGGELFCSVCLGPIKFNLFVFIWFLYYPYSALSLSLSLTHLNPNSIGGRGQDKPCEAKFCEKRPYTHNNTLIKQISLFDTASVMTKNIIFNSKLKKEIF